MSSSSHIQGVVHDLKMAVAIQVSFSSSLTVSTYAEYNFATALRIDTDTRFLCVSQKPDFFISPSVILKELEDNKLAKRVTTLHVCSFQPQPRTDLGQTTHYRG